MIYFDVGANDGSSTERFATPENLVFMFEPNPEMVAIIESKHKDNPSVLLYPTAISDYCGQAEFNVCVTHDRGCSSLLDVSEAGKTEWGGRTDMIPAHKINVAVWRLDELVNWDQVPEIEFFHCDTQGSDLHVLQGMGEYIKRIKRGVVEAGTKPDILYNGQNTVQDTIDYLVKNGFVIDSITSNDAQTNEVNILFHRG